MNPDLAPNALAKPERGSGRAERRKNKLAAKTGREPETHAAMLERVEFWRVLRLELFRRDGGRCRACKQPLDINGGLSKDALHCHHVIHRSAGGADTLANLACLCSVCHRLHHDGRLSITGEPNGTLQFTSRTLKGVLQRAWEDTCSPML